MKTTLILFAACLLCGGTALAQTTPNTTNSSNTVGLGGTVSGSTGNTSATTNATPTRYDNRNSGMPSETHVKMKKPKEPKMKHNGKMKSTM